MTNSVCLLAMQIQMYYNLNIRRWEYVGSYFENLSQEI